MVARQAFWPTYELKPIYADEFSYYWRHICTQSQGWAIVREIYWPRTPKRKEMKNVDSMFRKNIIMRSFMFRSFMFRWDVRLYRIIFINVKIVSREKILHWYHLAHTQAQKMKLVPTPAQSWGCGWVYWIQRLEW